MDVSQRTVLVVEDSPLFRKLVGEFLHTLGVRNIIEASNGRAAIEQLAHSRPDLVCLDLTLPDVSGLRRVRVHPRARQSWRACRC